LEGVEGECICAEIEYMRWHSEVRWFEWLGEQVYQVGGERENGWGSNCLPFCAGRMRACGNPSQDIKTAMRGMNDLIGSFVLQTEKYYTNVTTDQLL